MLDSVRKLLRRNRQWVRFQELNREGWGNAARRWTVQGRVLGTRPVRTSTGRSSSEVRVLTWRRDWLNAIWALKSFYASSGVDWPLFLHDGGLEADQAKFLKAHFPDATIVSRDEATRSVEAKLRSIGLDRCITCRRGSVMTQKFFDVTLLSEADRVVLIDSDVVFFQKPLHLLDSALRQNQFNRDPDTCYALSPSEISKTFGVSVEPRINAGLSSVWRESINFRKVDDWLEEPRLSENPWITEQTLYAMCSSEYGVRILPEAYQATTEPGIRSDAVAKHYLGNPKPLLYCEGYATLMGKAFWRELAA